MSNIDSANIKLSAADYASISQTINNNGTSTIGVNFINSDGSGTRGGAVEVKNGEITKVTLSGEVNALPANGKTGSSAQTKKSVNLSVSDTEFSLLLNGNGAGLKFKENPDGSSEITGGTVGISNFQVSFNQTETSSKQSLITPIFSTESSTNENDSGVVTSTNKINTGIVNVGLEVKVNSTKTTLENKVEVETADSTAALSLKPSLNLIFTNVTIGDTFIFFGNNETTFTDTVTGVTVSVGNSSFFPTEIVNSVPVTDAQIEEAEVKLAQAEINLIQGENTFNIQLPNAEFDASIRRIPLQYEVDAAERVLTSLNEKRSTEAKTVEANKGLTVAHSDLVDKLDVNNDRVIALEDSLEFITTAIGDNEDIINRLGGRAEEGNAVARLIGDDVARSLNLGSKKSSELGYDADKLSAE